MRTSASPPDRARTRRARPALVACLALAVAVVAAGCSSGGTTTTLEGLVRDQPLQVGDRSLPQVAPDGTATPFTFHAADGGLLFVAFGYTNCPDVCPTTLYDIKKALAQLGDDADRVQVAFATVDPERDTPEVLNQYLGSFVADGHPLRTTDTAQLRAAQDAFGVTSSVTKADDGRVEVAHTARSFVVDDTGAVVDEWAFGTSADAMASDLQILLDRQDDAS